MARFTLNGTNSDVVFWPAVGADVYVKWNRNDEWTFLPFITPVSVTESVPPQVGQATFSYDFGTIKFAETAGFENWNFYTINGAYIAVVVYDYYGSAFLWEGIVDLETVKPYGNPDVPSGEQLFTAFSLEHLLDRRPIIGAYTEAGYIDTPKRFNRRKGRGVGLVGNRSDTDNVFGVAGDVWNNLQIADYVIDNFAPSGIEWIGVGQTWSMALTEEEHDFDGGTVFNALNKLIDRRRGLAWRCISDGSGPVYIYVFSMSPIAFGMEGAIVEANADQCVVDFSGYRNVQHTITFNNLATFDTVEVRGGCITSTMSLSYTDGTLEEGWSVESEADYNTGGTGETPEELDAARGSEVFDAVYAKHKLIADWDGGAGDGEGGEYLNAIPGYWPDGTPDADLLGIFFSPDHTFERTLPLEVESSTSDAPEYRRAFVVVKADPEDTYDPNDPETPDDRVWAYADKLRDLGEGFENMSITLGDRDLSINVTGRPALLMAKFTFDPELYDSSAAPIIDYRTMIATVTLRTDMRIRATWITPYLSEIGRTKMIVDADAEAWYVVPGTVIDVQDGALVRHEGGWLRDDSPRLRQKAVLAAAWYATPRATLAYDFSSIGIGFPCGTMIRGVEGPEGYTEIGTVVTQRTWTFSGSGNRTTVQTGYQEIDFPELGKKNPR